LCWNYNLLSLICLKIGFYKLLLQGVKQRVKYEEKNKEEFEKDELGILDVDLKQYSIACVSLESSLQETAFW
jgi:hypothetical protein